MKLTPDEATKIYQEATKITRIPGPVEKILIKLITIRPCG